MPRLAPDRRAVLKGLAVGAAALAAPPVLGQARARIVVIGGGFAGATAARALQRAGLAVTLIEPSATFTACPFSNEVIGGLPDLAQQQFTYEAVKKDGVTVVAQSATAVDAQQRRVTTGDGTTLDYDRLVMAPGIDLRFDALPGYNEKAVDAMPHAWKAG